MLSIFNTDITDHVSFTSWNAKVYTKERFRIFKYSSLNCDQSKLSFTLNAKVYHTYYDKHDGHDYWAKDIRTGEEIDLTRDEFEEAVEEFINTL